MKTMKKLLSLCLALCLVLGLATPAFAAMTGAGTIADPFVCESVADFPAHVMVNGADTAFFQVPAGGMTLTINHEYAQIVNPRGMVLADCSMNGSSATYTFAESAQGDIVMFGICNPNPRMGIDVSMVLSNEAPEIPVGTQENPDELVIGSNEANVEANSWGYFYSWTAESYGELVIAMDCESWEYQVSNVTSSWQSDIHASSDEAAVWAETLYVCPGDEIQVCVNTQPGEGWGEYPAGAVAFSASFAGQDEKFEYIATTKQLMVGENYVATERAADVTVCEFCPDETGVYTITAALPSWESEEADLQVGYWGANPFFMNPPAGEVTDTTECTITSAGQTAMIGVSGASMVVLTIEKTGEYVAPVTTVVEYDNGETPEAYTLGAYDVLAPVDEAQATAVLGEDGYYHLDNAEGAVLVVDLVGGGINMADAAELGQLNITVKNDDGYNYTKTDFTNAFNAYAECAATENEVVSGVKVYPATEGLVAMIEELAQAKGWYEFAGIEGWLGMCKAVKTPAVVAGGVQLIGPAFSDAALLALAAQFESAEEVR